MRALPQKQIMSWSKPSKQDLAGEPALVRAAALRYLGRREYTAAELRQRLTERGAQAADIVEVLECLRQGGYQSDARTAEVHIRQRICYAPRGRALVAQELKERGVSAGLVSAALQEHYPPEAEQELLQRLLAKEARHEQAGLEQAGPEAAASSLGSGQKTQRQRQKLARRLLAKGFRQSLVLQALEEWLPLADDNGYEYP